MLLTLRLIYALLSSIDLVVTLYLIKICKCNIEANVIAYYLYEGFGPMGMIALKAMSMLLVLSISVYVAYKNISRAYLILYTVCTIHLILFLYSIVVLWVSL